MKKKRKIRGSRLFLGLLLLFLLAGGIWWQRQPKLVRLGVYAGSSWDVPTQTEEKVLDQAIARFEKTHPGVKIVYESGIPKNRYASWLANQILHGQEPDLYMVSSTELPVLAARGAVEDLTPLMGKQVDPSHFYPVALEAGKYKNHQYALPFESNPVLMCVNKDLLEKEGIAIPKEGWTLEEFYTICQKVTRDTDGDGELDQFGSTDYTWREALAAYGGQLFRQDSINLTSKEMKRSLYFIEKLEALHGNFNVTSKDFDEGKVAFYPMTLAQYRTYKPYPYHVAKYSNFTWTCIPMPGASGSTPSTLVDTSLFALSSRASASKEAKEFMEFLTQDQQVQQELFRQSQGTSVLPSVVNSSKSRDLLKADDFGVDSLTNQTLDQIMKKAVLSTPGNLPTDIWDRLDYLIHNALKAKDIDNQLPQIQKIIEEMLREKFR